MLVFDKDESLANTLLETSKVTRCFKRLIDAGIDVNWFDPITRLPSLCNWSILEEMTEI